MKTTVDILKEARMTKACAAGLSTETKNALLNAMADSLIDCSDRILSENKADLEAAKGKITEVMLDRLALSEKRLNDMADAIREVAVLPDPVGRILSPLPSVLSRLFTKAGQMSLRTQPRCY